MLISILSFLFIILVCVVVHEFGHYFSAVVCGVKVHEFSFGMGPLLWQKHGRRNAWSLRAFPVGGFVRLGGMEEEEDGETVPPGMAFNEKSPWQRLWILAAGAINNILLVVVLASVLLLTRGIMDLSTSTVGQLIPGYPAEAAGLQTGDVIQKINGVSVYDWDSMTRQIRSEGANGAALTLEVVRSGTPLTLTMNTKSEKEGEPPLIGIQPHIKKLSLLEALQGSLSYTFHMSMAMLRGLKEIFLHPSSADVAGPVGIAAMAGQAARQGWASLLSFLAIISLNLGIINLLPFPALDGGRIVFVLGEIITGRNVSEQLEGKIHFIGIIVLIGLILLITWQDVMKLF
ncbi:MAG: RIP metalloprotease RseP [Pyramidobacter sp.]|nr:RIP metalloprotease RseP [Pyramidobacter sp.]